MVVVQVRELRKAYNDALKAKVDVFEIKGAKLVTGFAKYLLEYVTDIQGLEETDSFNLKPTTE